jgi:hypothetical protein
VALDARVAAAAHRASAELIGAGAEAVALVGSHLTGSATEHSDLDLIALGPGEYRLEWRDDLLLAVSWRTAADTRASFRQPDTAGIAVPAWRTALILADPGGVARALQHEAHAWRWQSIGAECDRWVAGQVAYYAEDVLRLAGCALRPNGRDALAAAHCAVLAMRLTAILAVHRRLLLASENDVWNAVATREGPQWTELRDRALAVVPAPLPDRARAALDLYRQTVHRTDAVLDPAGRAVVRGVLTRIESEVESRL